MNMKFLRWNYLFSLISPVYSNAPLQCRIKYPMRDCYFDNYVSYTKFQVGRVFTHKKRMLDQTHFDVISKHTGSAQLFFALPRSSYLACVRCNACDAMRDGFWKKKSPNCNYYWSTGSSLVSRQQLTAWVTFYTGQIGSLLSSVKHDFFASQIGYKKKRNMLECWVYLVTQNFNVQYLSLCAHPQLISVVL